MTIPIDGFLEAVVRGATPLAFAALGELVAERSGVINLGLEGAIVCGALASLVATVAFGPSAGLLAGGSAGLCIGLIFAFFVLVLRAQQIIVGAAVSILGLGLSATVHRALTGGGASAIHVATLPELRIPFLADIPIIGPALFSQSLPTYILYALFPLVAYALYRTIGGVVLRAAGEHPPAVIAAGHSPAKVQFMALCVCGFLAGVGGATLVVAQTGTFSDGMSAGRGFIAVAVVALGRWRPVGVLLGVLLFGSASALQFLAQSLGWNVPYNIVLAAPYVLTLLAMAALRGSGSAPAALGRALNRSASLV
ncbi:MAG: ABC transporter permease [Gemmatimonadetes bacterium]|nr:ABC transporter permease [Gemmatimonadota bacterium]